MAWEKSKSDRSIFDDFNCKSLNWNKKCHKGSTCTGSQGFVSQVPFPCFLKMFVPYNIERITAPYSAVVYFNQPQGASHAVHWSKPIYSVFASFSVKHRKKIKILTKRCFSELTNTA